MTKPNGRRGRPPKPLDLRAVERLAAIGCSLTEIADALGIGRSTMYDRLQQDERFRTALERGAASGNVSLRRAQWKSAMRGSGRMLIWLGRQRLGQRNFEAVPPPNPDPPRRIELDMKRLSQDELDKMIAYSSFYEELLNRQREEESPDHAPGAGKPH